MTYIDYSYYSSLHDTVQEKDFNRLVVAAQHKLDDLTTGVDGVRKLKHAFPVDEEDAQLVRICMAELVNTMYKVEKLEKTASALTETESGVHSNVITSVSAGNESVDYAEPGAVKNTIGAAVQSTKARNGLYYGIVRDYLSGVPDANGVNLLYMGPYPYTIKT